MYDKEESPWTSDPKIVAAKKRSAGWKRARESAKTVAFLASLAFLVSIVVTLSIQYEWDLWKECREQHSFWYCYRVLSNK